MIHEDLLTPLQCNINVIQSTDLPRYKSTPENPREIANFIVYPLYQSTLVSLNYQVSFRMKCEQKSRLREEKAAKICHLLSSVPPFCQLQC